MLLLNHITDFAFNFGNESEASRIKSALCYSRVEQMVNVLFLLMLIVMEMFMTQMNLDSCERPFIIWLHVFFISQLLKQFHIATNLCMLSCFNKNFTKF